MFCHQSQIRVRYAETDQMGVVYYGHYAQYFEVGRAEAIRSLGFSYRALEENGIRMPVTRMEVRYLRPARYDDLLTVRTCVREQPGKYITFFGEIFSEEGRLITTGEVTLAFWSVETERTVEAPQVLLDLLQPWFP